MTAVEKGLVANWNTKCEMEGLLAVAEALRNSSPMLKGRALAGPVDFQQIPELAERGLLKLQNFSIFWKPDWRGVTISLLIPFR